MKVVTKSKQRSLCVKPELPHTHLWAGIEANRQRQGGRSRLKLMLRAASPVGCLCPLSRDRSQATMEINASVVDNTAAKQHLFPSKPNKQACSLSPLTHHQLTGSLIHIQAPIRKTRPPSPSQPSIQANTTRSLTHSLAHSPPFTKHPLTHTGGASRRVISQTCLLLHTHTFPFTLQPWYRHSTCVCPWVSLSHTHSHTGSQLS